MAWKSPLGPCGRISALLNNPNCPLLRVIKEDNFRQALRLPLPGLNEFLTARIDEIADIALELTQTNFSGAQSICFSLVTTEFSHSLTSALASNPLLLAKLSDFISSKSEIEPAGVARFCRIMQFLMQNSSSILDRFPDRETLFENIAKFVHLAAASHFLALLVDLDGKVIGFLEDNRATDVLLAALCDDVVVNRRVLELLSDIVGSADLDSSLLVPFESSDVVQRIFEYAITNEDAQVSARAFELLGGLANQCEDCDDADGDPLCETVVRFLMAKVGEICEFIGSGKRFLGNKSSAVSLICDLVKEKVPDAVIGLGVRLVGQMFANPTNSFLHRGLQSLFDEIARDDERLRIFCAESNIRRRILEAFASRHQVHAAYWGALFSFARAIGEKEEHDDEWKVFLGTTINVMENVIGCPFGGPKPGQGLEQLRKYIEFPVGKSRGMTVGRDIDEEDELTEQY
jgi:hypothetical protein